MLLKQVRITIIMLALLGVITGVLYPFAVTVIAGVLFPEESGGSLASNDGRVAGSRLIGQPFNSPRYFWGRPSVAGVHGYDGSASSGSNDGPLHQGLIRRVTGRISALQEADPLNANPIPVDLVTASGSGLDPHISVASAIYQVPRVARSRGLDESRIRALVEFHTEGRQFGFLGEARVNVLGLNLALDAEGRAQGGSR